MFSNHLLHGFVMCLLSQFLPFTFLNRVLPGGEEGLDLTIELLGPHCFWEGDFPESKASIQRLETVLKSDFQGLNRFTNELYLHGVSESGFMELFAEGLFSSMEFARSSYLPDPFEVNQILERQLSTHPDLVHSLPTPSAAPSTLEQAYAALDAFTGEWHGQWRSMAVDHLWRPLQRMKLPLQADVWLLGFQSCFTGDGFAWNYVVQDHDQIRVLGFVYYFDVGSGPSTAPLSAYVNAAGQLTWLTESHLYYEFVAENELGERHYVITGGAYEEQEGSWGLRTAHQAVYASTRTSDHPFRDLDVQARTLENPFQDLDVQPRTLDHPFQDLGTQPKSSGNPFQDLDVQSRTEERSMPIPEPAWFTPHFFDFPTFSSLFGSVIQAECRGSWQSCTAEPGSRDRALTP